MKSGCILVIFSLTACSFLAVCILSTLYFPIYFTYLQNVECKPEIPSGLIKGVMMAMKEYEETKTCSSYMKIVVKVSDMEKVKKTMN